MAPGPPPPSLPPSPPPSPPQRAAPPPSAAAAAALGPAGAAFPRPRPRRGSAGRREAEGGRAWARRRRAAASRGGEGSPRRAVSGGCRPAGRPRACPNLSDATLPWHTRCPQPWQRCPRLCSQRAVCSLRPAACRVASVASQNQPSALAQSQPNGSHPCLRLADRLVCAKY